MAERLAETQIIMHPFVLGELLLSGLGHRPSVLTDLRTLPVATVATPDEVEALIANASLFGRGIGYVDAALLASVRLERGARLWTRDRRLANCARQLEVGLGS